MRHSKSSYRHLLYIAAIFGLAAGLFPGTTAAIDVEPYVFAAQTSGSLEFATGIACIEIVAEDCPVAASTEDGDDNAWGLGAALRLHGPWWFDLRWTQQETDLTLLDGEGRRITGSSLPFDVSRLEAGVLYRFSDRGWSPFVTAFGGVVRFDSSIGTTNRAEINLDRASAGFGGGLLVDLGSKLGLRIEVRGTVTDLPEEFDGDLEQVEGSVGFRLRL